MNAAPAFYLTPGDPPSKAAILRAALAVFARDGVTGTSVRTIAQEAGYTNPALFKFFRSKDDLALYLFDRCYTECAHMLAGALREPSAFDAQLHRALVALSAFVDAHPDAFFFMQDNVRVYFARLSPDARQTSMLSQFRALLERGRDEGAVDARTSLDLQLAALVGFLSQLARMHFFGELDGPLASHVDRMHAMISRMLAP